MANLSPSFRADFESPYQAGRDAGINGPNTRNCHFTWFSSKERTAEWERGKAAGDAVRAAQRR